MEDNNTLKSWDAFSGNYLKADEVKSEDDAYVCTKVETSGEGVDITPVLTLERNELGKLFSLNKTNIKFAKKEGITMPLEFIGCKIYFKKVLVNNPKTGEEVDGLRISKIERTNTDAPAEVVKPGEAVPEVPTSA